MAKIAKSQIEIKVSTATAASYRNGQMAKKSELLPKTTNATNMFVHKQRKLWLEKLVETRWKCFWPRLRCAAGLLGSLKATTTTANDHEAESGVANLVIFQPFLNIWQK